MKSLIPEQYRGNEVNVEHSVTAVDARVCTVLYERGIHRLLNVNEWHKITDPKMSRFQVTDRLGEEVFREAMEGDLFRIDVPGPGSGNGEGFDWVKVEKIDFRWSESGKRESVEMRVRPVASPLHPDKGTAHFFDGESTSTFKLERVGNKIYAGVYGRNELPNIAAKGLRDKVRDVIVAAGAIFGASNVQWDRLVKGILGNPPAGDLDID